MNIVVIGDSHAKPGVSNRRFDWLGDLILDLKPDHVVDMGDWADMESLSSYDGSSLTGNKPKTRSFEGRRYKDDIEAGVDARDRIHRKLQAAGRVRPKRWSLGGNHDDERIERAINNVTELEGVIGIEDHMRREYGWEHIPFLDPLDLGGFNFQHYFTTGVMGRPIGGENPAVTHLKTQFSSCVGAHSHLFNEAHRDSNNRGRIQSFIAGCYLDPTQKESYAGPANRMWDKGILFMKGVEKGYCHDGFEWITMKSIQEAYA